MAGCDDEPEPREERPPISPKIEQLEKSVAEMRDGVTQTIRAHQPDTGIEIDRPEGSSDRQE